MSLEDVLARLHCLNVCMTRRTSSGALLPYHTQRTPFDFTYTEAAVEAPMYFFKPMSSCTAYVSVHQCDARAPGQHAYLDIGVTLLQKEVRCTLVYNCGKRLRLSD